MRPEGEVAGGVGEFALKVEEDGPEAGDKGGFLRSEEEALDSLDGIVVFGVASELSEAGEFEAKRARGGGGLVGAGTLVAFFGIGEVQPLVSVRRVLWGLGR